MTNQAVNPVDLAIQQAKEQAANSAANPASQPAIDMVPVNAGQAGGVAVYSAPSAPSLMDLTQGAMSVDGYLKVKEFGLLVDSKPNLVEKMRVAIDTTEMNAFTGVRFSIGNNVQYLKTYDGVNCSSGGTWTAALQRAQMADPACRPYTGADIAVTLLEDAKDAKGAVVAETGVRLGHSTSITNKAAVGDFIKEITKQGLMGSVVEAELSFKPMTNKNGQSWGIITFNLIGAHGGE